ncbi:hypothetical protein EQG68_10585 [Flavobacterium piscinae]|uniref:Uncharacterized protein n=1 Tax=Flavobacterium piscinae TaxID=2506424 RepID=A0A4Q1KPD8_9FLAO|nr:hypothetical protein [Flavobacterium piscinae]RXR31320.1 hypothetical protein EQG68_10585 [Flavobacterium piscinae]
MKAETVFNVAIHLSKEELIKLQVLVQNRINEKPKKRKKRYDDITMEEAMAFIKKRCFSRKVGLY